MKQIMIKHSYTNSSWFLIGQYSPPPPHLHVTVRDHMFKTSTGKEGIV